MHIDKKTSIEYAVAAGICALCLAIFFHVVIGVFSSFNTNGESVFLDFSNFHWQKNFRFFSFPHFKEWHSDYLLYPYGIDMTFINWFFELNIFGSIASLLNIRAWAQLHYLFSLAISFLGIFAIIRRYRSFQWSLFFAFVLTFCNYAAICTYPAHYTLSPIHWSMLSIVLDFVMVDKFWRNEWFSARFLLAKFLCIVLCLGLELGYIASFAYFSFFVCAMYILISVPVRTRSITSSLRWVSDQVVYFLRTFGTNRKVCIFLCACILLFAWIYVPVALQITLNNPSGNLPEIWPTRPLRIFHPILPWFNPATTFNSSHGVFGQNGHTMVYAWSAGLFPLACSVIGIVSGGKRGIKKWIPFILILASVMLVPLFSIAVHFPAFRCSRIPTRFSNYLIVLMMAPLFFSCGRLEWRRFTSKHLLFCTLLLMLVVGEITVAYSKTFLWAERYRLSEFKDDYLRAVDCASSLPGEGLFFFPFTAHGGDANGFFRTHELAALTAHQMQFAAKCGKKANCCYIGRMFSSLYLKDFPHFAWQAYIMNDVWTEDQWSTLKRFFQLSNFAAFVVNRSAITENQYSGIVAHFGAPVARFDLHGQWYEIMPTPNTWRGRAGNSPQIADVFPVIRLLSGFSAKEHWGAWTIDTEFSLQIDLPDENDIAGVAFRMQSFNEPRSVEVFAGEQRLAAFDVDVKDNKYIVPLPAAMEGRTLVLRFTQDGVKSPRELDPNSGDARTLGVGLCSVELVSGNPM